MEHQRLHRTASTVEVGVADVGGRDHGRHLAQHAGPPAWLVRYETRRPRWLIECLGEIVGVFFYVSFGVSATLAWNITTLGKVEGAGSLLNVALAYCFGIVFGILVAGPVSGGHLSPAYTIAFALFKGFPWRKVPQYIFSQILGAFLATLLVYAQYGQQSREIVATLHLAGADALNFTPQGIAGSLALFPTPGQPSSLLFLNEFVTTTILAILVFSVLDSTNIFVSFATAPFLIGFGYAGIILGFAVDTVTLNTARDLGGRFACGVIYGKACFPMQFSAIAALTNILGSLLGAAIQVFLLSDHRRPHISIPPPGSIPVPGQPMPEVAHGNGVATRDVRSDNSYPEKNTV